MAEVEITGVGSSLGSSLTELLLVDDILPGTAPSYQTCKTIYSFHPLGAKMAEAPIKMAQSQEREITVGKAPDEVAHAFVEKWKEIEASKIILNQWTQARIYGIASIVLGIKDVEPMEALKPQDLAKLYEENKLFWNVLDPLITSGSLIFNQDPNSPEFQRPELPITASGKLYHRSRSCTVLNEQPIYIEWSQSAFGYVGRSVYQRSLFPLKSFIQSMITDDMVTRKAGLLVAKIKQAGPIINGIMQFFTGLKTTLLKMAGTNNVLTIGADDSVETLDMQNIDGAAGMARKDVLENIAVSADMPAKLLNAETFAEGFGEGTEDAKNVARYVDRIRIEMQPSYDFMDPQIQRIAWTPELFKSIQNKYPDRYEGAEFNTVFQQWRNDFRAGWPSLLTEPDSEKVKTDEVKVKTLIAVLEVVGPSLDPDNKATLVEWAAENLNETKMLFSTPLKLDIDELRNYTPPAPVEGEEEEADRVPEAPKPFAAAA